MKVLAVGSHPDDIEFGCGGVLLALRRAGHHVSLLVMSANRKRKKEQKAACKLAEWGIVFGGYVDTDIRFGWRVVRCIERELGKKVLVDYVFTHYPDDTHQDHRNVSQATIAAARNAKNILYYEGPTTLNFNPTVFVEFNDVLLNAKTNVLKEHTSQLLKTNIHDRDFLEMARSNAVFRGIQARTKYAESFVPVRMHLEI